MLGPCFLDYEVHSRIRPLRFESSNCRLLEDNPNQHPTNLFLFSQLYSNSFIQSSFCWMSLSCSSDRELFLNWLCAQLPSTLQIHVLQRGEPFTTTATQESHTSFSVVILFWWSHISELQFFLIRTQKKMLYKLSCRDVNTSHQSMLLSCCCICCSTWRLCEQGGVFVSRISGFSLLTAAERSESFC